MTDTDRTIAAYALWRRARIWKIVFYSSIAPIFIGPYLLGSLTNLQFYLVICGIIGVLIVAGVMWIVMFRRCIHAFGCLTQMPCPDCGFPLPQNDDTASRSPCAECGRPHSTLSARPYWDANVRKT
ncbi:MAG: hypothetical protein MUE97_01700 [Phycisphaerales bacterium]|jgi:hypothetical protein|nr:hypothetical protein [Phycisphaerales bacterium]